MSMKKKIDSRIHVFIENGVISKYRSMFVIVGDKGRDQVPLLHHIQSKVAVKARPSVLWCYKKELGFSSHRKKRMKQLNKKIKAGQLDAKEDDPFELFIASTNIRYTYYAETHKILGNTYGMCVLQDFEALTPNLLARTIETVEGGGIIVILLRSVSSLQQLYTINMDAHSRLRTESHQDVVGRFNERFILSLGSCPACMVIDDRLNLLPVSKHVLNLQPLPPKPIDGPLTENEAELKELKESLKKTPNVGVIVDCCKTLDQAKAVLRFIDAITEKTLRSTVALTAARGRGKSAALGLAMASAVASGYSNIYVTAPSPENLKTMFEFVFMGFDALAYQRQKDYEIIQSTNPEFNKAVVRVNVTLNHRQFIQYIHPTDSEKLGQAELVIIDEAAAIPLPLVKKLIGPYLVFMCSTVNGYEGTGRSLSLKLLNNLRHGKPQVAPQDTSAALGRAFHELTLEESIRYGAGDPVESWLYRVLCLDTAVARVSSGCPLPADCQLYYVNRDTLFSFHRESEAFLQRLMSLYVASHYKNTPNDLQMLSDAPAHHIFVLLPPMDKTTMSSNSLPEVLCVLQVCLEGEISKQSLMSSLSRGQRASGDLIPWTVSQQFGDTSFGTLSGARVVRIATHPDYQGMGYGSRALEILQKYYSGEIPNMAEDTEQDMEVPTVPKEDVSILTEQLRPRKHLPPLVEQLSRRRAERLDYLGVSFGLTLQLAKFWKRAAFVPVYIRQTPNELTGECSCIMLKSLHDRKGPGSEEEAWLEDYWNRFRERFLVLLSFELQTFSITMALSVLQRKDYRPKTQELSADELSRELSADHLERLERYAQNMADWRLITDLLPRLASLFFSNRLHVSLSPLKQAILLGIGLQRKSISALEKELEMPGTQILGNFNKTMRKISDYFTGIQEKAIESTMLEQKGAEMVPLKQKLEDELTEAAAEEKAERKKKEQLVLKETDLSQYAIKGSESQWEDLTKTAASSGLISIKGGLADKKRKPEEEKGKQNGKPKKAKKFKKH